MYYKPKIWVENDGDVWQHNKQLGFRVFTVLSPFCLWMTIVFLHTQRFNVTSTVKDEGYFILRNG